MRNSGWVVGIAVLGMLGACATKASQASENAAGSGGSAAPVCRQTTDADEDAEDKRIDAAVDNALRVNGLTRLTVEVSRDDRFRDFVFGAPGKLVAGPAGSYELPVAVVRGCGNAAPPIAAMNLKGEVFVIEPKVVAKKHWTVLECENSCRGACGAYPGERAAVVRVPPEARFAGIRELEVPIDVQVTFAYQNKNPCNVP